MVSVETVSRGFVFPVFAPSGMIAFGAEGSTIAEPLHNPGNATAWPVFVVKGDYPDGFTVGFTTDSGRQALVEYLWPVVSGVPVEIDMAGHAWVNGTDQQPALGVRQWGGIPPGESITPFFHAHVAGGGVVVCRVRPTFQ